MCNIGLNKMYLGDICSKCWNVFLTVLKSLVFVIVFILF